MILTITLISILFGLIIFYLWTINNRYDYFKRRGIPGPPHRFFFGHYKELWSSKSFSKTIQQWTREYGSIYGIFEGSRPMYVVSDADFIQEVYIKQFSSFHSRAITRLLRVDEDNDRVHLFRAIGPRWRRQRQVINPTFSTAKLKLMSLLMNECIEAMLNKLSETVDNQKNEINIYDLYKRMTLDVICKAIKFYFIYTILS
jgi:cytochrome P450